GILLADEFAADLRQVDGNDLAGVRRAEGDLFLSLAVVLENGHEERLAREDALAGAKHLVEEAAAALLLRTVTKNGVHVDAVLHVHHPAGFRDGGFGRVQFNFDELHLVAEDLIVDIVHLSHTRRGLGFSFSSRLSLSKAAAEGHRKNPAGLEPVESGRRTPVLASVA